RAVVWSDQLVHIERSPTHLRPINLHVPWLFLAGWLLLAHLSRLRQLWNISICKCFRLGFFHRPLRSRLRNATPPPHRSSGPATAPPAGGVTALAEPCRAGRNASMSLMTLWLAD